MNRLLIAFLLIGGTVSFLGYQWFQVRVGEPEVRNFIEAKVRDLLETDLTIGKIRYLPPARVVLEEVQIKGSGPPTRFSILRIEKLVLGYGLLNLIRWDFNLPGRLVIDRPKIRFSSPLPQVPFLEPALSKALPTRLAVQGGEFRYPLEGGEKEFVLQNVRLDAKSDVRGRIRLELASEIGGVAGGKIEVKGFTDPEFRHYELEVRLRDLSFLPTSGIPLRNVRGELYLSENLIEMKRLTGLFHDWEVQWKGKIENWQATPRVFIDLMHKKGKSPFHLAFEMDFQAEKLLGEAVWLGRNYLFLGKVVQREKKILFQNLELPHGYTGAGIIDRKNGDYRFEFHRERRRFQISSNLNRLEFQTHFQLDHVPINRLDWVVSGRAHIASLAPSRGGRVPRWKGWIQTDYFIVETEPLQDFQGSFELDSEGIHAMDFRWGGGFQLEGRILFKGGKPRQDLVLRVEGFPLGSIRDFGGRPLPPNLTGLLEGKLKLWGEVDRPEIQGYFTIKDGTLEKLDFDRALVEFRGFAPYLKLYDSKIFRGRNTLKLLGAIDLGLENIFHGIQIKGPDHLVIWKGVSAFWKEGESAVGAEKPLGKKLAMGLEVGAGNPDSKPEDGEERYALLGPKVRF